jgi:formylglycine-generating enzyme required for sulfatase activity
VRFPQFVAVTWLVLMCAVAGHAAEPAPLTAAQERGLKAKDSFRECEDCPKMVVVPAGRFTMGSPRGEKDRSPDEGPQHVVTIGRRFAVGKFHVTLDQFATFVQESGYQVARNECGDSKWSYYLEEEGSSPVDCVSWDDANAYANWLAKKTGKPYRLLSEAEWEYAARSRTSPGTYPRFWFGNDEKNICRYANGADKAFDINGRQHPIIRCNDGYAHRSPVGHYKPNAFGLYDMAGNAWQWTADCYHDSYNGAPTDGSAWTTGTCNSGRVVRGGSWGISPEGLRAAYRGWGHPDGAWEPSRGEVELFFIGFRVARMLAP